MYVIKYDMSTHWNSHIQSYIVQWQVKHETRVARPPRVPTYLADLYLCQINVYLPLILRFVQVAAITARWKDERRYEGSLNYSFKMNEVIKWMKLRRTLRNTKSIFYVELDIYRAPLTINVVIEA